MLFLAGSVLRYRRGASVPVASSRLFVHLNLFMALWLAVIALDGFIAGQILFF